MTFDSYMFLLLFRFQLISARDVVSMPIVSEEHVNVKLVLLEMVSLVLVSTAW